jgi:hypothetical protein
MFLEVFGWERQTAGLYVGAQQKTETHLFILSGIMTKKDGKLDQQEDEKEISFQKKTKSAV